MTRNPPPPPPSPPQTLHTPRRSSVYRVLIVGNYCHDVLIQNDSVVAETLGGAASFIPNVLNGLSISCDLISKVGHNFKYGVDHAPIVVSAKETTVFEAYFDLGLDGTGRPDRLLKRVRACDPIFPSDLPEARFDFGMAVGVGGEILPETLEKMVEICDVVSVDIQALIRGFDSVDGTVNLVNLKESGFYHVLPKIGFLKASSEEAPFVDVEQLKQWCCVVVTNGKDGCRIYHKDEEITVSPFPANQVDPTGAGDSFLGGFVAGLVEGLAVSDAALLGNLFGSVTVEHIGLPKFDLRMLQKVEDEIQDRKTQCRPCSQNGDHSLRLAKPSGHDEFHARLRVARLIISSCIPEK